MYPNNYPYYSQYNSYPNTLSQQIQTNNINSSNPPPPGISPPPPPGISPPGISPPPPGISPPGTSNFTIQPGPPGTSTSVTQNQTYPYYSSYQYPYYNYQNQNNTNNLYTHNQSFSTQPLQPKQTPPAYTSTTIPKPPGTTVSTYANNTNNTISKEQENKSYNQVKFNINSSLTENKTFKPEFISVQVEKVKNTIENNKKKEEEMKKAENKKKGYPQELKDYIARMYRICPKDKRDVLEVELKKLIADANLRNVLYTVKWENMGLPAKCLENSSNVENTTISNNLLVNKKRKRFAETSSSSSTYSSQISSTIEMDESLMRLPENERMEEIKRRERRAKRFNDDYSAELKKKQEKEILKRQAEITKQMYIDQNGNPDVVDWDQDTLVGTCQDLEKNYLRLTSAPDPATVRPLPVLRKTLLFLKEKWQKEQNYNYICDQFKSLRQDLTVQRIKNEFTVEVYEIHARIALEKGDLGEYNQCQSQLKQLYKLGFKGHEEEFISYRLLYYVHTLNPKDINTLIAELTPEQKEHPYIKYSLDVRSAVANGNYHKFFDLFVEAPENMAVYLMDHFLERERIKALKVMTKSYLTLSIPFIADELSFDDDNECIDFLKKCRCPIKKDKTKGYYTISGKETHQLFLKRWQELTKKGIDIKGQI